MNYLIKFDKPIPYRTAQQNGTIDTVMVSDTNLDEPRHKYESVVQNVDDVICLMTNLYPEIQNYEIRETLLSLKDLEENDKIRTE